MPSPSGGRCEYAKWRYGSNGTKDPDAIATKDGSDSTPPCIHDASCGAANTIDVHLY